MKEFLLKVFDRLNKPFGEAALEFAGSMALGYLRLSRCDMQELFDRFINNAKTPSAFLGLLILAQKKQT